jgi:Tol biopolymer transport system component
MRRKVLGFLLCAAALAAGSLAASQISQAELDLQAANRTANISRDPQSAIAQYEAIVRKYPSDRVAAAKALLGIADSYRALADASERSVLEELAGKYSDRPEGAAAQKRLTAMVPPALTVRKVCADCFTASGRGTSSPESASITPDGRWLVTTMGGLNSCGCRGEVALRDLSTDELTILTEYAKEEPDKKPFISSPVLSPDRQWLAHTYVNGRASATDHTPQLRVMANQRGAESKVLIHSAEFVGLETVGWFDDSSILLGMWKQAGGLKLARVSISDGAIIRVIKEFQGKVGVGRPRLSPDGKYIAYSAPAGQQDRHIHILAADGSDLETDIKTSGINDAPLWTPDGAHILFVRSQAGSRGALGNSSLWAASVKDGKIVGDPWRIQADIKLTTPVGVTNTGSYYYVSAPTADFQEISIRNSGFTGLPLQDATGVGESFAGSYPKWSRDGKFIAFARGEVTVSGALMPGAMIIVRSLDGKERSYPGPDAVRAPSVSGWFTDGTLLVSAPRGASYRLDLEKHEFTKVAPVSGVLSLDEKTLYTMGRSSARADFTYPPDLIEGAVIMAFDIASGTQREVFRLPHPPVAREADARAADAEGKVTLVGARIEAISHDGRTLLGAFTISGSRHYMFRVGVDGSGYRELIGPVRAQNLEWSPDDREILFVKLADSTNPSTYLTSPRSIVRIPADGRGSAQPTVVLEERPGEMTFHLSPDGARMALSQRILGGLPELHALDNLSAVLNSKR